MDTRQRESESESEAQTHRHTESDRQRQRDREIRTETDGDSAETETEVTGCMGTREGGPQEMFTSASFREWLSVVTVQHRRLPFI